ncbi:dehydrogenase/reductase SDR family member 9-like [Patella vulgata]|uniref:dehydrogenase/reductase SDR family member 9-like n=1 Tax=Patella vulgata TaxID=6465 RepID=UPI0024A8F295|nr:dehydrogenase/reductase SDR family member 9-like [Patella vulgata]
MLPLWIITVVVGYFTIKWFLNRLEVGNIGDKYVFITGCDTGFGNALAKKLDGLGFHVIASCLNKDGASELKKVTSERLTTVLLDVTSTQDVKRVMEEIDEMIPVNKGLWAIVNNAGIPGSLLPFDLTTKEDFEKVLSVNLLGLIDVCIKCVPLLRKGRTKGRVINVSSVTGRFAVDSDRLINYLCNGSIDPEPVVSAMTHAVTSRFPNLRYVVGLDAKYIFSVLRALPKITNLC